MALPTNADVIVVHGYWLDELTGVGVKQDNGRPATIMFDPVPLLGANAAKTPNLRDLTSNAHLKTRTRVATVDPVTGYYAAQLVASNDPDLDAYSGRKVTFLGEDPFTIEVPYNAPTVTVSAEMAAKTGLTQGASVKAIWLPNASVTTIPTPTPSVNYLSSSQTLANIAAGIEDHDEDPAAHADIRALIPAGYTDEQARDTLAAALVAGSNVTITPNDSADTITISATGGSAYGDEQAQDAIAALFAAGTHSGISFAYNDAGNAISATVAAPSASTTVNPLTGWLHVTGFGATGNGTTDDSSAITSAVAALTGGQTLYFAPGSYRFAQQNPTSTAAIGLSGKSNVGIVFAPGAELLMDNLDGSGHGTSHGVAVYGSCADIRLEGIRVRWASTPSTRSLGDGFRFLGYPSDSAPAAGWTGSTGTIRNLQLINCTSQNAPQTGGIFLGCSDVRVLNFRAQDTLADGLHFNACRNVMVAGHQAINCGDDGLAFVTYYHATNLWEDAAQGPFAFSDLGGWSNYMTNATGVVVRDGAANGCRISGSLHVTVTGLSVENKASGAGLIVDSARAGGGIVWDYQASRAVSVSNLTVHDCGLGIRVAAQNINSGHDSRLWTFGARITGATLRNNTNWAVRVEGDGSTSSVVAGLELSALKISTGSGGGGNGAVGLSSLRDSFIGDIYMDTANAADFAFFGQDSANTGALSTLPRHNVTIGVVQNTGGRVFLQDLNGVILGSVRSRNAPQDGFIINGCANVEVGTVRVEHPNRTNNSLARAVMLNKTVRCTVRNVYVETDSNNQTSFRSLEIGGGDATDIAASGLRVGDFTYTNTLNQTGNDIVQQGGPYAPAQYQVTAYWYNGGEASPIWRAAKIGDFPVPA